MKKRILSALIALAVSVNNLCGVTFVSAEEQGQAASEELSAEIQAAEDLEYGDLKYRVEESGTITITDCNEDAVSVVIPSSIDGLTVTAIGNYAFYHCTSLTDITIPNSVNIIGNHAFEYCTSLTDITIPNSVTIIKDSTFRYCASLTNITIPNSVTTIGYYAFYYCTSLTNIAIPNSVTTIGYGAFWGCTRLTDITIPNSVTTIDGATFWNCTSLTDITIPNSVTTIGYKAFLGCTSLTDITIPNSVTTIGEGAFSSCISLTDITIPNSVTAIRNSAFERCTSLTNITIPNSVTTIEEATFSGCKSLTDITIPNSVTTIAKAAFYECTSLTNITIPNSVTIIGTSAFERCTGLTNITIPSSVTAIGNKVFYYCTSLTDITIPNSVTTIGDWAFAACKSLINITIPNSVTTIEEATFSGCISLTDITIPNSVITIGKYAFNNCTSLTDITIPDSVTTIGEYAFSSCTSLTDITIPNSVITIEKYAFYDCYRLTNITIPNSVTTIGYGAFWCCNSLTNVYYGGSASDWNEISIGSNNEELLKATIHYNSTGPVSEPDIPTQKISGTLSPTDTCTITWECTYKLPENGTPQEAEVFVYVSYIGGLEEIIDLFNEKAESGLPMPWELDPYNIPKTAVTKLTINGNRNEMLRILPETFKGYTALTNLKIFNIYEIGDSAFEGCRSLRMVENLNKAGNETLKRIGANAFKNCSMLDSLTVGKAVGYIGEGAFDGCSRLVIGCYINTYAQRYFEKKNISYKVLDADISNYVPFYSATGDQTTMLDIGWGDSLFTTPTTTYSNRLATLGLALSADTEVSWQRTENTLKRLGFEEGNIKSCSYGVQGIFSPGVTFAYKDITINGQKKPLLIIAVRGTTIDLNQFWGWGDIITDILGVVGGFSISAEHTAFDFGNFLRDHGISDADIANGGKIFITGHSLGGAVANLLAKKYSDKYFGEQSVYCYTYASPFTAVIKPADKKYNNIHNLIHGEDLVPHTGVGLSCGTRYGRNYDDFYTYFIAGFKDNFYTLTGKKYNPDALDLLAPHDVSVYMAYVMSTSDLTKYKNGRQTVIRIACPVDAEVYGSNGELVGTVKDGNAETLSEGAYVFVEGEEKYFVLADDDDYKIVIKGTDKGTMEYTVYSYSEGDGELLDIKTFSNVSIEKDKEFASYVSVWDKNDESIDDEEKIDVPDVPLYVVDENGDPEKEVLPDGNGTELPILPPIMLGDLNNDSRVTIADARMLLQAASGSRTLTEEQKAAADVNGDGKITIADARWLLQVASGSRVL